MASGPLSKQPISEATYYDEYSDPEQDEKPENGVREGPEKVEGIGDGDDYDEEEDEDGFLKRPRRETPPQSSCSLPGVKRKTMDQSGTQTATNGGRTVDPPPSKRHQPEPLEPSILNAEPLDEFVLEMADWIHKVATGKMNIEVEAKVGLILDTRTNERINLPVLNETILAADYPEIRFSSNMTIQQHAAYNHALNKLAERTSHPSYPNAKIRYEHTRVIDSFYTPAAGGGSSSGSGKVRLTTDAKTGEIKECIQKVRIADLNIYSPKRKLDWRVSVNTEVPAPIPTSGAPLSSRRKDRMTYTHQSFKVDLTQVTPSASHAQQPSELLHELEIEFADPAELMRAAKVRVRGTGAAWSGRECDLFDELVRVFVNNVRILVRNAG